MSRRKFQKGDIITHKNEVWFVPPREIRKIIKNGYQAPYLTCDDYPSFLSYYEARDYKILRKYEPRN